MGWNRDQEKRRCKPFAAAAAGNAAGQPSAARRPTATAACSLALSRQGFTIKSVPTKPIEGQKTGTSGLRKKTKVFMSDNYLANWWVLPASYLWRVRRRVLVRQRRVWRTCSRSPVAGRAAGPGAVVVLVFLFTSSPPARPITPRPSPQDPVAVQCPGR